MADFAELKSQITGLVTSLEEIEREAATLQDTNKVLQEIAQTMNGVCGSMAKVIKESEMVYDYVNETSAQQTLDSFHKAAAQFNNVGSNMALTYANETAALKAHVDESIAQLNAEMQKKIIMLGGAAIACAVIAIVMAIIII